ncbi:hypothetical protein AB6870_21495 [Rahnella inusitata]
MASALKNQLRLIIKR